MLLFDMMFALLFAALFSVVLLVGFRSKGPWKSLFLFFIVVFLAAWAGGIWLSPLGPTWGGSPWLSILLVALIFALLLAAAAVPPEYGAAAGVLSPGESKGEKKRSVKLFFWFLLGILLAAIVIRYITVA